MTRSLDEAVHAVHDVTSLPYGSSRTARILAEVERIEAEGPVEALAFAYNTLVDAYVWGEEVDKAFVPFTRALRLYDERPDVFDGADAHSLFWSFKWMTGHLVDFPGVSSAQIDATLADMERRFVIAGHGLNAVRHSNFRWQQHSNPDPAAVAEAYEAWVATPRDAYSQCEACEPGDRAAYLVGAGRGDEAVRIIESVLPEEPSCATEPADMLAYLQLAYLDQGDAEGVARAHFLGLGHLEGPYDLCGPHARYAEVLGRTGNTERALRMIARVTDVLVGSRSPGERLMVLTHVGIGARALAQADPSTPVSLPGVPARDVAALAAWVEAEADAIAAAFDARNGNDACSRHLVLARGRAARTLDVDLAVLRVEDLAGATVAAAAGTSDLPPADTVDALLASAAAVEDSDPRTAAVLYRTAARDAEEAGLLPTAGFALAEAAQLAALLDDHTGAAAGFRRALGLLHAGGVDARDTAPVARAAARVTTLDDDVVALLATFDRLVDALGGSSPGAAGGAEPGHGTAFAARESAADAAELLELRDSRARLLATAGRLVDAAAEAFALTALHGAAGNRLDEAHAAWLAGRCLAGTGDHEGALEPLVRAATLFRAQRRRQLSTSVSDEVLDVLGRLGRSDEASLVLAEIAGEGR